MGVANGTKCSILTVNNFAKVKNLVIVFAPSGKKGNVGILFHKSYSFILMCKSRKHPPNSFQYLLNAHPLEFIANEFAFLLRQIGPRKPSLLFLCYNILGPDEQAG